MVGQCRKWFQKIILSVSEILQFNEDFKKIYNEESDEGYFLKLEGQYLEKLHELHIDISFLTERMKIKKVDKLVAN